MSWVFRNVRGLNKFLKQRDLGKYFIKNKIVLTGICEIRIKEVNVFKSLINFVKVWKICYNYKDEINGRIWLIWKGNVVDVQIFDIYEYVIYYWVYSK